MALMSVVRSPADFSLHSFAAAAVVVVVLDDYVVIVSSNATNVIFILL